MWIKTLFFLLILQSHTGWSLENSSPSPRDIGQKIRNKTGMGMGNVASGILWSHRDLESAYTRARHLIPQMKVNQKTRMAWLDKACGLLGAKYSRNCRLLQESSQRDYKFIGNMTTMSKKAWRSEVGPGVSKEKVMVASVYHDTVVSQFNGDFRKWQKKCQTSSELSKGCKNELEVIAGPLLVSAALVSESFGEKTFFSGGEASPYKISLDYMSPVEKRNFKEKIEKGRLKNGAAGIRDNFPKNKDTTHLERHSDCYPKKCKNLKAVKVCVVEGELPTFEGLALEMSCRGADRVFYINGKKRWDRFKEWNPVFAAIRDDCQSIYNLTVSSHGAPGSMSAGLDIDQVSEIQPSPSCFMRDHSKLELHSCLTGGGCRGALFFKELAAVFFKGKSGTIVGSEGLAIAKAYLYAPTALKSRVLKSQVRKTPSGRGTFRSEVWTSEKLNRLVPDASTDKMNEKQICKKELTHYLGEIRKNLKIAKKRGCKIDSPILSPSGIKKAEVVRRELSKGVGIDRDRAREVFRLVDALEFQSERLITCKAPKNWARDNKSGVD